MTPLYSYNKTDVESSILPTISLPRIIVQLPAVYLIARSCCVQTVPALLLGSAPSLSVGATTPEERARVHAYALACTVAIPPRKIPHTRQAARK
jgi:hypothetical protein